jgi:glycosyltransferase involved in cell wall biosynthesis
MTAVGRPDEEGNDMADSAPTPRASVIIPTYNRADLLRLMLEQLTRQTLPVTEFEVIVSDDGSADDTAEVAAAFTERLRLKYWFQEDLGDRVSLARNNAAKLAEADLLIFLDGGGMIAPDLVERHLIAHDVPQRRTVCGYAWGYDPRYPALEGLDRDLAAMHPEQVLAKYRDLPAFRDIRHEPLAAWDFAFDAMPLPWQLFFALNCSMRAEDFRAVGGFDEDMTGWGCEDLEMGFKLQRAGISMHFATDAWIIEWPHERDMSKRWPEMVANTFKFLRKYPEPVIEIGYVLCADNEYWRWEPTWLELQSWSEQVADVDGAAEDAQAVARIGAGERIAVFGAGPVLPAQLPPSVVADFDAALVRRATAGTGHTAVHAVGVRTLLEDQSVDTVLITSRLSGLWDTWGEHIMTEAHRIGRKVELLGPGMTAG